MSVQLDGTKWKVENFNKNNNVVVNIDNNKQSVTVFNCVESVVIIKVKTRTNSILVSVSLC